MKASVITVVYNGRTFIEGAILSVLSQTHPDIEYIIVDGASTDGTMDVVHKYRDRIARIVSEPDIGVYDAMNKAIALATGDLLYFLGADDRLSDERVIADVVDVLRMSAADILYGKVRYVNVPPVNHGTVLGRYKGNRQMVSGYEMIRYLFCHQACFCKRSLFDRYGRFDLSYRIAADFNWLLKVVSSGVKMQYVDRHVVDFNVTGISSNLVGTFLESSRAVFSWYGPVGLACHIFWRAVNAAIFLFEKIFYKGYTDVSGSI